MKYNFILIATVAALSKPWPGYSDLAIPIHLEKRMMTNSGGRKKGHHKMTVQKGKGIGNYVYIDGPKKSPARADSPAREGDTFVSAKAKGPGEVATAREKNKLTENPHDSTVLMAGQTQRKETRDPIWSKAEAHATGDPDRGGANQSPVLHPAKVEGTGQSGRVRVTAPAHGGYAKLKKEVDGEVVNDERIPPGQSRSDEHVGAHPGEVKYTASSGRGGEAWVSVNNQEVRRPN